MTSQLEYALHPGQNVKELIIESSEESAVPVPNEHAKIFVEVIETT